jgi:hypothetical protein
MSISKNGLIIECESCQCLRENGDNGFDISVPIIDSQNGLKGIAKIKCEINSESHIVMLSDLHDADAQDIALSTDLEQRINKALNYVADHKVCGNRNICPTEITQIVKKITPQ